MAPKYIVYIIEPRKKNNPFFINRIIFTPIIIIIIEADSISLLSAQTIIQTHTTCTRFKQRTRLFTVSSPPLPFVHRVLIAFVPNQCRQHNQNRCGATTTTTRRGQHRANEFAHNLIATNVQTHTHMQ